MKHFNQSVLRRSKFSPRGESIILLVWLMVALLLPNLILAYTEGFCGWSIAAGVVLPLGIYLLLFIFTRRVSLVALALLPVLALCVVQIVLLYLYGNSIIAVDMFTNIMTTNSVWTMLKVLIDISLVWILVYGVLTLPIS